MAYQPEPQASLGQRFGNSMTSLRQNLDMRQKTANCFQDFKCLIVVTLISGFVAYETLKAAEVLTKDTNGKFHFNFKGLFKLDGAHAAAALMLFLTFVFGIESFEALKMSRQA